MSYYACEDKADEVVSTIQFRGLLSVGDKLNIVLTCNGDPNKLSVVTQNESDVWPRR